VNKGATVESSALLLIKGIKSPEDIPEFCIILPSYDPTGQQYNCNQNDYAPETWLSATAITTIPKSEPRRVWI